MSRGVVSASAAAARALSVHRRVLRSLRQLKLRVSTYRCRAKATSGSKAREANEKMGWGIYC